MVACDCINAKIPAKLLRGLRDAADLASEAAVKTDTQYESAHNIPKINAEGGNFAAKLTGLRRFDLYDQAPSHRAEAQIQVANDSDATASATGPNAFINLSIRKAKAARGASNEGVRPATFAEAKPIIEQVNEVCISLYRVANPLSKDHPEAQLATARLAALVEHAVTRVLPVPKPRDSPKEPNCACLWQSPAGMSKSDQVRLLGFLLNIATHYVAAGKFLEDSSSKFDQVARERVSRSTVTLSCLMAIFDALARNSTEEVGGGSVDKDALAKALCGQHLGPVDETDGHWMSTAGTDGTALSDLLGWQQLSDPDFLVARSQAYSYLCPEWAKPLPKLFECTLAKQTRNITVICPKDEEQLGLVRAIQEVKPKEDKKAAKAGKEGGKDGGKKGAKKTAKHDTKIEDIGKVVPLEFDRGTIITVIAKIKKNDSKGGEEWIGTIPAREEIKDKDGKVTTEGRPEQEGSFDPAVVETVIFQRFTDFMTAAGEPCPSKYAAYLKSTLKEGMALKCKVMLEDGKVEPGDLGEFKSYNEDPEKNEETGVETPREAQCCVSWWPDGVRPEVKPTKSSKEPGKEKKKDDGDMMWVRWQDVEISPVGNKKTAVSFTSTVTDGKDGKKSSEVALKLTGGRLQTVDGKMMLVNGKMECWIDGKSVENNVTELEWTLTTKKAEREREESRGSGFFGFGRSSSKKKVDEEQDEEKKNKKKKGEDGDNDENDEDDEDDNEEIETLWAIGNRGKRTKISLPKLKPDGDDGKKQLLERQELRAQIDELSTTVSTSQSFDPQDKFVPPPRMLECEIFPSSTVNSIKTKVMGETANLPLGTQRLIFGNKVGKGKDAKPVPWDQITDSTPLRAGPSLVEGPQDPDYDLEGYTSMKDYEVKEGDVLEVIRRTWSELHEIKVAAAKLKAERKKKFDAQWAGYGKYPPKVNFDAMNSAYTNKRQNWEPIMVPQGKVGWQPQSIGWEPDATVTLMEQLLDMKPPPKDQTDGGLVDEESEEQEELEEGQQAGDQEEESEEAIMDNMGMDWLFDDDQEDDDGEPLPEGIQDVKDNDWIEAMTKRAEAEKARNNKYKKYIGYNAVQYEVQLRGNPYIKWIQSDWKHLPEVALMRDMVMLFKLGIGRKFPASACKLEGCKPRWKYIDSPSYSWDPVGVGGAVVVGFDTGSKDSFEYFSHPEDADMYRGGPKRLWNMLGRGPDKPWKEAPNPTEEDILFEETLSRNDWKFITQLPSLEEQEQLALCATVPQLAIPLMLQFFASRVSALMNADLFALLETTLFESRDFCTAVSLHSTDEKERITVVPSEARRIGTEFGVLMNEVVSMPSAVFGPFMEICAAASRLCCQRNYTSAFVPLFLEIMRIACKLERFAATVIENADFLAEQLGRGGTAHSLRAEIEPWAAKQQDFIFTVALPSVREWLAAAEDDGDIVSTVCFHTYLMHIGEPLVTASCTVDEMSSYLGSVGYVMTWKESEQRSESRGTTGPEHPANMLSDVVNSLQHTRGAVGLWCKRNTSTQTGQLKTTMETVLERVAAVSFQADTLDSAVGKSVMHCTGWKAVMSDPVKCDLTRESDHPYLPEQNVYDSMIFPDAKQIVVTFDESTSMPAGKGSITFYKDDTLEEKFSVGGVPCTFPQGVEGQQELPGIDGVPPLVIPAGSFVVHFVSPQFDPGDATLATEREYWGYKFTASAAVSQKFADKLKRDYDAEMNTDIHHLACELALQDTGNQLQEAEMHLRALADQLETRASEQHAAQAALADSCVYLDSSDALKCSLQTADITLRGGTMVKVPESFKDSETFKTVINATVIPYCTVMASTDEMQAIELTYEGQHYRMDLWKPLQAPTREQIYAAEDAVRLKELIKGTGVTNGNSTKKESSKTDDGPWHLGGLDHHRFFPQQKSGYMEHAGSKYSSIRTDATLGPASETWLQMILPTLLAHAKKFSLDEKLRCWIRQGEDTRAPVMLYYVSHKQGGAFFEVFTDNHPCGGPCLIVVYRLQEYARSAQRVPVFTSDARFCLTDPVELDPAMQIVARETPWSPTERFAVGWLLDGCYMSETGSLSEACASSSLSFSRDRSSKRVEAEIEQLSVDSHGTTMALKCWLKDTTIKRAQQEVYVPASHLFGLIPHVLAAGFQFWCGDDGHTRGYNMSAGGGDTKQWQKGQNLLIFQQPITSGDSQGASVDCLLLRLPDPLDKDNAATVKPAVLLNPLSAPEGSALAQAVALLTKIERLSHLLFWSQSWGCSGEVVDVSEIQLPRLGLSFHTNRGDPRLHCTSISGLFVSNRIDEEHVRKHADGIQHCLLLQNDAGELSLLCSCVEMKRLKVADCPMNTEAMATFGSQGYFLYPLHVAGMYLQCTTRAATLYLIYLRMVSREYVAATELIAQAFVDNAMAANEQAILQWICDLEDNKEQHPDAVACHLRVLQLALSNGWGDVETVIKVYAKYQEVETLLSACCRYTVAEELTLPIEVVAERRRRELTDPNVGAQGPPRHCENCDRKCTRGGTGAWRCGGCNNSDTGERWQCTDCDINHCENCYAKLSTSGQTSAKVHRTGRSLRRLRQHAASSLERAKHLYDATEPNCATGLIVTDVQQSSVVLRWTPPVPDLNDPAPILGYRVLIIPPKNDSTVRTPRARPQSALRRQQTGTSADPNVATPSSAVLAVDAREAALEEAEAGPESPGDWQQRKLDESNKQLLRQTGFWDRMYTHHLGGHDDLERSFFSFGGSAQLFSDGHLRWKPTTSEDDWYIVRTVQMLPDASEVEVVDLLPSCEYSFRVQAFNRVGVSSLSESRSVTTLQAIERISGLISFDFSTAIEGATTAQSVVTSEDDLSLQTQLVRGASVRAVDGRNVADMRLPGAAMRIDEINGLLDPMQHSERGYTFESEILVSPPESKASKFDAASRDSYFEKYKDSTLMGQVPIELVEAAEFMSFLADMFKDHPERKTKCARGHSLTNWFVPNVERADSYDLTCNMCNHNYKTCQHEQRTMMRCQSCDFNVCKGCQGYRKSMIDVDCIRKHDLLAKHAFLESQHTIAAADDKATAKKSVWVVWVGHIKEKERNSDMSAAAIQMIVETAEAAAGALDASPLKAPGEETPSKKSGAVACKHNEEGLAGFTLTHELHVTDVSESSVAYANGLRDNQQVTHIDGKPVKDKTQYDHHLGLMDTGEDALEFTLHATTPEATRTYTTLQDAQDALFAMRTVDIGLSNASGIAEGPPGQFTLRSGTVICEAPQSNLWCYKPPPDIQSWTFMELGAFKMVIAANGMITMRVDDCHVQSEVGKMPLGKWCKLSAAVERNKSHVTKVSLKVNEQKVCMYDATTLVRPGMIDGISFKKLSCTFDEAVTYAMAKPLSCDGFSENGEASAGDRRECLFRSTICPRCMNEDEVSRKLVPFELPPGADVDDGDVKCACEGCKAPECGVAGVSHWCASCEYIACNKCWSTSNVDQTWRTWCKPANEPIKLPSKNDVADAEVLTLAEGCPCCIGSVSINYGAMRNREQTGWGAATPSPPADIHFDLPPPDPSKTESNGGDSCVYRSHIAINWQRSIVPVARRQGRKGRGRRQQQQHVELNPFYSTPCAMVEATISGHLAAAAAKEAQAEEENDDSDDDGGQQGEEEKAIPETGLKLFKAWEDECVYVESVVEGSASHSAICRPYDAAGNPQEESRIQPGQRLLSVNGIDATGYDVQTILAELGQSDPCDVVLEAAKTYRVVAQAKDPACQKHHLSTRHGVTTWPGDLEQSLESPMENYIIPEATYDADKEGNNTAHIYGLLPGVHYVFWVQTMQAGKLSAVNPLEPSTKAASAPRADPTSGIVLPDNLALRQNPVTSIQYVRPEDCEVTGIDANSMCIGAFTGTETDKVFGLLYDLFVGRVRVMLTRTTAQRQIDLDRQRKGELQEFSGSWSWDPDDWDKPEKNKFAGGFFSPEAQAQRKIDTDARQKRLAAEKARARRVEWDCPNCGGQDRQNRTCGKCFRINPSPMDYADVDGCAKSEREKHNVDGLMIADKIRFRKAPAMNGFGMVINENNVVVEVTKEPRGSAFKKGIRINDRIVSVDDKPVTKDFSATMLIGHKVSNDAIKVGFVPANTKKKYPVKSRTTSTVMAALATRALLVSISYQDERHWFLRSALAVLESTVGGSSNASVDWEPFAYLQQHTDLHDSSTASVGPLRQFFKDLVDRCLPLAKSIVVPPRAKHTQQSARTLLEDAAADSAADSSALAADPRAVSSILRQYDRYDTGKFCLSCMHVGDKTLQLFAGRPLEQLLTTGDGAKQVKDLLPEAGMDECFITTEDTHNVPDHSFEENMKGLKERAEGNPAASKSLIRLQNDLDRLQATKTNTCTFLTGFDKLSEAMKTNVDVHSELLKAHARAIQLEVVLQANFVCTHAIP